MEQTRIRESVLVFYNNIYVGKESQERIGNTIGNSGMHPSEIYAYIVTTCYHKPC